MSRLLTSLDAPPSGRARPVWFDAAAYGRARLLGGGDVPWPSPAELSSFFAKIGGMFHSDAILVDLADLVAQRAAADQRLRAAMAARSRPGYALRTLLADEQARGIAAEAVRVLASTSGAVPLVLSVPTPGRWLVGAAQQAQRDGSEPGPPDAAQAETAAIYSADFLRTFAGTGVDGLLLDEGRVLVGELIHPEAYRPVLNVAGHYEWPVLIRTDAARGLAARPGSRRRRLARLGPAGRARRAIRSLGHRGRPGLLGWRAPAGRGRPRARPRPGRRRARSRHEAGPGPRVTHYR